MAHFRYFGGIFVFLEVLGFFGSFIDFRGNLVIFVAILAYFRDFGVFWFVYRFLDILVIFEISKVFLSYLCFKLFGVYFSHFGSSNGILIFLVILGVY